jgi:hypothetical protein
MLKIEDRKAVYVYPKYKEDCKCISCNSLTRLPYIDIFKGETLYVTSSDLIEG